MKRFVEQRRYEITFSPLDIEFRVFNKLLPILGQRIWSLLIAPTDGALNSHAPITPSH